jgi:hypothetical protein
MNRNEREDNLHHVSIANSSSSSLLKEKEEGRLYLITRRRMWLCQELELKIAVIVSSINDATMKVAM